MTATKQKFILSFCKYIFPVIFGICFTHSTSTLEHSVTAMCARCHLQSYFLQTALTGGLQHSQMTINTLKNWREVRKCFHKNANFYRVISRLHPSSSIVIWLIEIKNLACWMSCHNVGNIFGLDSVKRTSLGIPKREGKAFDNNTETGIQKHALVGIDCKNQ